MRKTGEAMGDLDGCICWLLRFLLRNSSSCFCLTGARGYTLVLKLQASGMSSMAWSHCFWSVSEFKPGSALLDPVRGQPMSLGPLRWSIMSSDGLVHPQKIIQVYLM